MRGLALAGMLALSTAVTQAQTTTSPQAPAAPTAQAPAAQAAASRDGSPANLCQEMLAFMKSPPPEAVVPAAAKKPAAGATQGTTGPHDPAKSQDGSGSAQKITGQSGVATDAPEPGRDGAASGSANNAPQKESRAAPLPPANATSTPKEFVLTIDAAERLAEANDIAQCQKAARHMRVAGVAMPAPLIALAALDMQYQHKEEAPAARSGPAGGQGQPQTTVPQ